jgi:TatD DNase family protein
VEKIVSIGCDVPSSRRAIEIAEQFPNVFCTVGVHPCYVMDVTEPDWAEQIEAMAAHPKVVALGEMGLDYFHAPPEGVTLENYKTRQAMFFQTQLDMAARLRKNIVVHQRNSYADGEAMVAPFEGKLRAQFHCFINTWEEAQTLIAQGHVISFTGIATYPKAPEVQACALAAKSGTFMVETDGPYLTPHTKKGQRCEPAFVRETAQHIASLRGISLETLAKETSEVASNFFGFH